MRRAQPPGSWLALLRRLLPASTREEHEGDLIELWSLRRERGSRWLGASFWYDAVSLGVHAWICAADWRSWSASGRHTFTGFGHDVRLAARVLLRRPLFSAAAIGTFTFGIAASTAIFTIADRTLVQPLSYRDPDRIVVLDPFAAVIRRDASGVAIQPAALTASSEFLALGFYEPGGLDLDLDQLGGPVRLTAAAADSGFFRVLGVPPLLGRTLAPDDGGRRVAVVSFDAWRQHFGHNPSLVGRSLRLSGQAFTVVGVMPRLFAFPEAADVWIPPAADGRMTGAGLRARVIGRLADDVSIPQAAAMLANVKEAAFGERQIGPSPSMAPIADYVAVRAKPTILFLVGLVSLLLTASSASVASLLLSRLTQRAREMRIRNALGAGTGRLVRQILTESLVIATMGSATGTVLAFWLVRTFAASLPVFVPGVELTMIDLRVVAISAALSVLATALFSLAPVLALRSTRSSGVARFGTPAVKRRWVASSLLTSQIAIALVLLVATSTLLSLVVRLTRSEFGLHNRGAVTFQVTLPASTYRTGAEVAAFAGRLETTLRSMPGTRAIGLTDFMPSSVGAKSLAHLEMRERPVLATGAARRESHATMLVATHDYFRAVGVPLLAGRFFEPHEAEPVVILNESAARMFAPDVTRVVGKRLVSPSAEIVGVVGDVQLDVDVPEAIRAMAMAHVYRPLSHSPPNGTVAVAVDMAGDVPSVVAAIRRGLHDIDPSLAIDRVSRVGDLPARIFASEQLTLALASVFALVVLGLAGIGLYGVLAQSVAERTREIGIRMALGASRAYLRAGIVCVALRLTVMGIVIGAGLAVTAWRLAWASIPSLDVPNLHLLAADAAVLIAVSVLAAWIPARRASAIDPVEALRAD